MGLQGFYNEAKKIKKKIKELKLIEREKHEIVSKGKHLSKSQLLVMKHQKELQGIKKKHASQRETLEQQRKKEFEIIERRFVNVWNEMEGKFRKELQKLEKSSPVKKMHMREQLFSASKATRALL